MFHSGQNWNKWEHAAAAGRRGASSWQSCVPQRAGPSHRKTTACSSATLPAASPTTGCSSNTSRIIHLWLFYRLLSAHTHTQNTRRYRQTSQLQLNNRLIWSLKGIFLISSLVSLWKQDSKSISRDKNFSEILDNSAYTQNRKGKNNSQQASWSMEIFNILIQSTFSSIVDISTIRWHLSSYNANSLNLFLRLL